MSDVESSIALPGVVFATTTWILFAIFMGMDAAPRTSSSIALLSVSSTGTLSSGPTVVQASRRTADLVLVLVWPSTKPCGPPHRHLQSAAEETLDFTRGDERRSCAGRKRAQHEAIAPRRIQPLRKSTFDVNDGAGEACARHNTSPIRLQLRAGKRI